MRVHACVCMHACMHACAGMCACTYLDSDGGRCVVAVEAVEVDILEVEHGRNERDRRHGVRRDSHPDLVAHWQSGLQYNRRLDGHKEVDGRALLEEHGPPGIGLLLLLLSTACQLELDVPACTWACILEFVLCMCAHACTCAYVCVCACMYVCMHVCMHMCLHLQPDVPGGVAAGTDPKKDGEDDRAGHHEVCLAKAGEHLDALVARLEVVVRVLNVEEGDHDAGVHKGDHQAGARLMCAGVHAGMAACMPTCLQACLYGCICMPICMCRDRIVRQEHASIFCPTFCQ